MVLENILVHFFRNNLCNIEFSLSVLIILENGKTEALREIGNSPLGLLNHSGSSGF
jgi:hypothetical protein